MTALLDSMLLTLISRLEHNSFDDHPWILRLVEYTKKAIAHNRVRIFGICFGHQIIGRSLGVKVGRSDKGWELSVLDMDLTEQGKKLFGKDKLVRYIPLILLVQTSWRMAC